MARALAALQRRIAESRAHRRHRAGSRRRSLGRDRAASRLRARLLQHRLGSGPVAGGYDQGAEPPVPSFVMDLRETTPVLHPLVAELVADERLAAYAEALPAPARVSEPALPLVLAALHEHLGRGLVCLLPEDADARDAADGARWFLGDERVALLPSRGVHWGSGLEPPPHLVGERARALEGLAAGGLVCVSATAASERMPPAAARPAPIRLA